ncbi:MAG: TonB-dependent receptor [Acidobacteria bacterium]|nr:TonB-dependent receptor [Acidobacteriota bacterium]
MKRFREFALGALIVLTSATAFAQATAQLSGTVRDESGAVLPGVTVTVTQTDTGLNRTAVSDETGVYLLTNLPTGPYRLEVALQGFKTYVQTGIVLQVGGTPTVNATLAVGSLEESVTVDAAAPLVDVRSAGISTVVDNEAILELPLQGRQVTDLIVLAGAAVQTGTSSSRSMAGGVLISVGGGLPFGVAYTLDGAAHNEPQSNTNLPLPFPDALQEFEVATSGLSAQSGVKSGASVNAVTKSGTNRFSGGGFEFLRDRRFNAPEHFAAFGPDGKQVDDGLRRNQFGGTLGGPIVRNKLFFFGAYQGTVLRQVPSGNISYVPTPQMLAGDFTTITSPQCAGGRQITLGAPFVGNRINPALFSPAALNLVKKLPQTTDPCGEIKWEQSQNEDQHMPVTRIDFQMTNNQLIFGRYLGAKISSPPSWTGPGDNILKTSLSAASSELHSLVVGHTQVVSTSVVNAVRATYNHTKIQRYQPDGFFSPADVGVKMYSYPPANQFSLSVTNNFAIMAGTATKRQTFNDLYAFSDDLTVVKGSHQLGFGADVRHWQLDSLGTSRTGGTWTVDGSATGHALADLLTGRVSRLEIGGPNILDISNVYLGAYAQDAWRTSNRVTINAGVRWEPYFGQSVNNNAIVLFRKENFDQGIKSKVFLNAPPGLIYPGDEGFPDGKTGLDVQWWNLAPRIGVAWDVHGDGRLAVRSSYSMGYDFMAGEYHNINAGAPPFGNRSLISDPPGRMDDPWGHLGGDPHPITLGPNVDYIPYGAFGSMDPSTNSPRAQQWNVMLERQLGSSWGVSATYLGSYADRLWAQTAINPGVFLGLGPCTLNTATGPRTFPVCSTNANLNERRKLSLENPTRSVGIGALDLNSDVGWQKYRGLKLSARHRTATGVSLNANYTLSKCEGTPTTTAFNQTSAGYTNPDDPDVDAGYCDQDRKHLGTLNLGYQTPEVGNGLVRALAANWRLSGILSARSGNRLNVTSGVDRAFNGISAQRPDQVSDDIYGPGKDTSDLEPGQQINDYLNRNAFALPAAGTVGNATRNVAVGPRYWQVDLAISKLVSSIGTQRLELRLETFNLFNTFNWGDPATNLNAANFGRITTQAGAPRIIQFGVKYDF